MSLYAQDEAPRADLGSSDTPSSGITQLKRFPPLRPTEASALSHGIFNRHVAMEAELGGYHNGDVNGFQFDSTSFTYLFGPRLSLGRQRRIDPYFHILFGGQYFTTSIAQDSVLIVNPLGNTTLSNGRYHTSQIPSRWP